MSEEPTFGSQFLDALDRASGCKNFNYAKRKEIRGLDRTTALALFGLTGAANAPQLTAEEAVQLLKKEGSVGISQEEEDIVLNTMMTNLNLSIISSD